jgi:hypothetical protein
VDGSPGLPAAATTLDGGKYGEQELLHLPPLRTDDGANIHSWPDTRSLLSPMPAKVAIETRGMLSVPPSPACPVVDGVVDASHCTGYSPADATAALQAAFHSGAHTVLVKNMSMTPWLLINTVYLGSNQTVKLEAGAVIEAKRFAAFWNDSKAVSAPHPLISTGWTGSFNVTIQGAAGAIIRMVSTARIMVHGWNHRESSGIIRESLGIGNH